MSKEICNVCNGLGQTKQTSTVVVVQDGKSKTTHLGSGCPKCLGLGVLDQRNAPKYHTLPDRTGGIHTLTALSELVVSAKGDAR